MGGRVINSCINDLNRDSKLSITFRSSKHFRTNI